MKKNELIKQFCDVDENGNYHGKRGKALIDAMESVYGVKNRNDKPFLVDEIVQQPELKDFKFEGVKDFKFICKLKGHLVEILKEYDHKLNRTKGRINEYIEAYDFASDDAKSIFNNAVGVVYILTAFVDGKEYIIKIGQSRNTFNERLASYNCGALVNWRTASTTNVKILQSMVANDIEFGLHLYGCCSLTTFTWHGVESEKFPTSESLAYEHILNHQFMKEFGRPALANVQVNITDRD